MPAVQPPSTILVTGASGFIAAWIVLRLLEKGFNVIGTVRSEAKGQYLANLFAKEGYGNKFSYIIVDDITKPGIFDECVKYVDAVVHAASPAHSIGTNPAEYYIRGVVGILESIASHAPQVKRVVMTSSVAAILEPHANPYVYSELDWNDNAAKLVDEIGNNTGGRVMYAAFQTMAERAAWAFVNDNARNTTAFDLVTILPPWVFGPTIHEVTSVSSLNTSIAIFRSTLLASASESSPPTEDFLFKHGSWVDVRNVAEAHVEAVLRPEAGGERFVTSAGHFVFQDFLNTLSKTPLASEMNKGFPENPTRFTSYSSGAKAANVLGIEYIDLETSGANTVTSLLQRFGKP